MAGKVKLTTPEKRCCHMSGVTFDWRTNAIEKWQREFREIPRTEHCADCPVVLTSGKDD